MHKRGGRFGCSKVNGLQKHVSAGCVDRPRSALLTSAPLISTPVPATARSFIYLEDRLRPPNKVNPPTVLFSHRARPRPPRPCSLVCTIRVVDKDED